MEKIIKTYLKEANNINIKKNILPKQQIILLNTGYLINDYISLLQNRNDGYYSRIPTFTIDKLGNINQYHHPLDITKFFNNPQIDDQAITIALENMGWLKYNPNTNKYYNWCNIECKGDVTEKKWRQKNYWENYTDSQFNALIELLDYLCKSYNINHKFIGNNIFNNRSIKFKGILNRSNYSRFYYDLTPAFDFEKLHKKINTKDNNEISTK
jgi:hypothetical protein